MITLRNNVKYICILLPYIDPIALMTNPIADEVYFHNLRINGDPVKMWFYAHCGICFMVLTPIFLDRPVRLKITI